MALETGVVSHDDLLIWDGVVRDRSEINRDLTLVEAFALSALPHYQQLVREIGKAEMKGFLTSVGYGNANMDGGLDRFWIDGGLRISPIQQVQFLERLLANRLPFSLETMKTVKKLLLNAYPDPSISAKTGWTDIEGQNFGWWVGWKVNQGDPVIFDGSLLTYTADISNTQPKFITNVDGSDQSNLPPEGKLRDNIPDYFVSVEYLSKL